MVSWSSKLELFEKGITVVHGSGVKKAMVPQFHHKHSPAPTKALTFINKTTFFPETLGKKNGGNES